MYKKNSLVALVLMVFLLLFCGCEKKTHVARMTIEQDGPIYSIYPDEINGSSEQIEYAKNKLNSEIMYHYKLNDDGSNVYVNNDIYNFLVVFPIKSKENFFKVFSGGTAAISVFYLKKCDGVGGRYSIGIQNRYTLDVNNTYHYILNAYSNEMESKELLSKTGDICMKYEDSSEDAHYKNDYQTNTITIKAQEIKDMLDNLGIVYE